MIYFEVFITLSYFITLLMRAGVHVPQRSHGMSSLDSLQELVLAFHYMSFWVLNSCLVPGAKLLYPLADPQIFSTQGQELRMVKCLLNVHKTVVSTATTKL